MELVRIIVLSSAAAALLGIMACSVDDREVYCADCDGVDEGGTSSSKGGASSSKGGATSDGGVTTTSGGASSKGGATAGGKGGTSAGGNAATSGGTPARGGSAATGGSTTGGTGTGGAAPMCRTNLTTGTNNTIDDFEDGNLNILPLEGRSGTWIHLRSDTSGSLMPELLMANKAGEISSVLGFGGPGMQPVGTAYPWAHVQAVLYTIGSASAPKSCVYDASAYDGIYFQAIGTANIRMSLEMDLNVPPSNTWGAPGACAATSEGDCYDRYGRNILIDSVDWREYYVPWADLTMQGFGAYKPTFSPARLHAIYFEVAPDALGAIPEYAVAIDEVAFIPRGVTPPNPAP